MVGTAPTGRIPRSFEKRLPEFVSLIRCGNLPNRRKMWRLPVRIYSNPFQLDVDYHILPGELKQARSLAIGTTSDDFGFCRIRRRAIRPGYSDKDVVHIDRLLGFPVPAVNGRSAGLWRSRHLGHLSLGSLRRSPSWRLGDLPRSIDWAAAEVEPTLSTDACLRRFGMDPDRVEYDGLPVRNATYGAAVRGFCRADDSRGAGHRRRAFLRIFLLALRLFGSAVAIFAICQSLSAPGKLYFVQTPLGGSAVFGPYVNHNHYAGLMEMLTPLALVLSLSKLVHGAPRMLTAFAAILMAGSIVLSGSRSGTLSLIVELALLFWITSQVRRRIRSR